mgnify:CR=1 FL=1
MFVQRRPRAALSPLVKTLWISDQPTSAGAVEHVLPSGAMHLAIRLSGAPVRLIERGAAVDMGFALVGGARSSFYAKEVSGAACTLGAVLQPGASVALFGVPASELAERHTRLEDLWGPSARGVRERLADAVDPLGAFEAMLMERAPRIRGLHPAVAMALEGLHGAAGIGELVEWSGYSHRRFNAIFRDAMGLTPKLYSRLRRFDLAVETLASRAGSALADVAALAGYSDQAHLNRDFVEFAGVTPGEYRRIAPRNARHVAAPGSNSFKT